MRVFVFCGMLFIRHISTMSCMVKLWQTAIPTAGGLAVTLGQSQGQVGEEFVQGDVGLGGEVPREFGGDHHEDAVGQYLRTEDTVSSLYTAEITIWSS